MDSWDPDDTAVEGTHPPGIAGSPADHMLGAYRLLGLIAKGGMGEVWRAEDPRLGRTVAIKLLRSDHAWHPLAKSRFLQEARAASALDHPNVCPVYEIGETADHGLYLVMPFYDGVLLQQRLGNGPLPVRDVLDIGGQISAGLCTAHRKGIVHRDIKPSNLLVTGDGVLKIIDFGIAKLAGAASLTRVGVVVGTLAYMSPEQLRGDDVDERTDLWSLGVVLYEMLAGRSPFRGDLQAAVRESILRDNPEPLRRVRPDVPASLEHLITALLKKDSKERISSAESVQVALRQIAEGASALPIARWMRTALRDPRPLWAVLILLGCTLVGAFGLTRWRPGPVNTELTAANLRSTAPPVQAVRRRSVAVLGFQNLSEGASDQWLGPALTEMLTAELAAGGKLRVISSERTAQARRSLGLLRSESADQAHMESLHALVGSDFALTGTYLPLGDQGKRRLRLDIRVLTMPAGDTVASVVEVGDEPELFDLVARAGTKLRSTLGLSRPTADERLQVRELLPAGSEAVRLYTEALLCLRLYDPSQARDLLLRAEALEPRSAVIQAALSETWSMLGQDLRAYAASIRAFNARESLPQEAKLGVEARFYETGKRWDEAINTYRSLWALVPDELQYGLKLAETLGLAGRGLEGLTVIGKLREYPSPDGNDPRIDLAEAKIVWLLSDRSRLEQVAAAAIRKSEKLEAWLIAARGLIFQADVLAEKGRAREAIELLRKAEGYALRVGDRYTVGQVDANMGELLLQQGNLEAAAQLQERALATARELGTGLGISSQLELLGQLQEERGNLVEARSLMTQSVSGFRRMMHPTWVAQVQSQVGKIYLAQGEPSVARSLLEEALDASRSIGRAESEVRALLGLAQLSVREGRLEQALRLQEEAIAILLRFRNPRLAVEALTASSCLLARTGDPAWAHRRFLQAQAVGGRAHRRLLDADLLGTAAWFALREGDLASARSASETQLRIAREAHAGRLEAGALRGLARVERAAGETRRARELFEEAIHLTEAGGNWLARMETVVELARLDLEEGDVDSALKLTGEAAEWNRARQFVGEAPALAVGAEALLRLGRLREAMTAADRARALVQDLDQESRLEMAPALARVQCAGGDPKGALRNLDQAISDAGRTGFLSAAFEARLARGEILLMTGDVIQGQGELRMLQSQASAKDFRLYGRRSASLLTRPATRL